MLIVDAHLDLAMNAMEWNRDLRMSLDEIRGREEGMADKPDRGHSTVNFEAMRRGCVGLCVATQIARWVKQGGKLEGWRSPEQAWAQTQGQLAWYRAMEEAGEMKAVRDVEELQAVEQMWEEAGTRAVERGTAIGYVLSLEGADSIVTMGHLERAWGYGLRAVGPAHYGEGVYAIGTGASGGIGNKGRELLRKMEELGMILDATHLCDESFREAMDVFGGAVWASHSNCRALVGGDRQFADEQLRELIGRGAVIGAAMDAWMLAEGWVRGKSEPGGMGVVLGSVVDHIDHVCQLAGNADHAGIGTDLDGGYGREQCPADMESIGDVKRVAELLRGRGYGEEDVAKIMGGNWVAFLKRAWGAA